MLVTTQVATSSEHCASCSKDAAEDSLVTESITNHRTQKLYAHISHGCTLVAFLLPIKLSLSYIALCPLLLAWLYLSGRQLPRLLTADTALPITAPLIFFLALTALSALVGLSPLNSAAALISLFFFALTVPLFASRAKVIPVCTALIAGQSLAALHSFFDAVFPHTLPKLFLGRVTESGQLALSILVALGLLLHLLHTSAGSHSSQRFLYKKHYALGCIVATSLVALGFHNEARLSTSLVTLISVLLLFATTVSIQIIRRFGASSSLIALTTLQIPLMACALIVNLKRGPWLGVLVGTVVLCFLYARRLVAVVVASAAILATTVTPVRERVLASYDHFTIEGGRSTIWRIGLELTSEYPLGIGYHNSRILRQFAPEIPPELNHFHNNLINIAAETGWLGLATFTWLLFALVRACFRDIKAPLYVAIGCGIVSWQVAGSVEYNFGDSEVMLIVWVLLGLILQRELKRSAEPSPPTQNH